MHTLVLFARICRRVADWSIYNTFKLTPDMTPKQATSKQPLENGKQEEI